MTRILRIQPMYTDLIRAFSEDVANAGQFVIERCCSSTPFSNAFVIEYDLELARHHARLMRALTIKATDCVLDLGCGRGQTTRDVAAVARQGFAVGIDIARSTLRVARDSAKAQATQNVSFVSCDAGRLPFGSGSFDIAISRFGTMFFADPVSAFHDIRRSLRAGGQLVMMVWQSADQNEWAVEIEHALRTNNKSPAASDVGASAFSLGDTASTKAILHSAGLVDVAFEDVREPVNYGESVESALAFVRGFATVTDAMSQMSHAERENALARLRMLLTHHLTADGVLFQSASWIVTATNTAAAS